MENVALGFREREAKKSFLKLMEELGLARNSVRAGEDREEELGDFIPEMGSKTEELHGIERLVEEKRKGLLEVEKLVREKERKCGFIKKCIEEGTEKLSKCNDEIKLKQWELNEVRKCIEEGKNAFDFTEDQVREVAKSLEECQKKLKLKKKELCLVKESLVECSDELELKEKMIRKMESKVKGFDLVEKSVEEWSCKLKAKEKELEECFMKFELRKKQVEWKVEELGFIDNMVNEWLNEVQLKERQLEELVKELGLKQKQYDLIRKSMETTDQFACNSASRNGRSLQLLMNEQLKRIDFMGSEISTALQVSSDPAKLVLDAMQGFYPSNLSVGSTEFEFEFDLGVVRRSCVLLLQELKSVSPQISPYVREKALALAADWKAKMMVAAEHSLEILGFLRLISTYDITDAYDPNELQNLLAIVSQQEQATELCQSLGITNMTHAGDIVPFPDKSEEPEVAGAISSPNLQLHATTDARTLPGSPNECVIRNQTMRDEMFLALQMSSNPAKHVLKLMQTSFSERWRKGHVGFEPDFMITNMSMLNDLTKDKPHVGPDVTKDAISLAIQWQAKMITDTENSLEILGFLQFIATYGLLSILNGDKIVKFLGMICQHKQAQELCQTLGFADKIPDFIQNLIERKKLVEAVRFICTFKLIDKFHPVLLLKTYVAEATKSYRTLWLEKHSLGETSEVVDNQIADLRSVIQCIKDNNLESELPSEDIEMEIVMLEKMKENWRSSAPLIVPKVEQEQEKGNKKRSTSSFKSHSPQPCQSKRFRQC